MGAILAVMGDPISIYRVSGSKAWGETAGKLQIGILVCLAILGSIVAQTALKPKWGKHSCASTSPWGDDKVKTLSIGCFDTSSLVPASNDDDNSFEEAFPHYSLRSQNASMVTEEL